MPTIPLYNPTSADDAWHQVASPGGYEWWYFDAEDAEHDRQIAAIFLEGFIFHPGYLRAYGRYRCRPTKFAPPLPREYACAYFVVYERGRIKHQFMTQYPPGALVADTQTPSVVLGPNRFSVERQLLKVDLAGTPWKLTARGPVLLPEQTLEGKFIFEPLLSSAPHRREFVSSGLSGAEHHWIVANPLCKVRGTIRCAGESIEFNGRGYHDHNYGTAPLGPGLKRWLWGRVLMDDSAMTFHYAQPRSGRLKDEIHLIRADAGGVGEISVPRVDADWSRMSGWLLRYPETLSFGESLKLARPRLVDSSPFYLRVQYDAEVEGKKGRAFCEIAYPHRLRLPILGRMIEMSIDKRRLQTHPYHPQAH